MPFIPSAPLVPENDASVLFNTAGMQPLVPYLLGETSDGNCLADVQNVRTGDIDDVGDNTHHTFFEMLETGLSVIILSVVLPR